MPNWVYNTLTAKNPVARDFTSEHLFSGGTLTFEGLLPMPEILRYTESPCRNWTKDDFLRTCEDDGFNLNLTYNQDGMLYGSRTGFAGTPQYISWMDAACKSKLTEKYGAADWYDWRNKHWGCKWDATTDLLQDPDAWSWQFRTPWSAPDGIWQALAEQCPAGVWDVTWEEEQGFGEILRLEAGRVLEVKKWNAPIFTSFTIKGVLTDGNPASAKLALYTSQQPHLEHPCSYEAGEFLDMFDSLFEALADEIKRADLPGETPREPRWTTLDVFPIPSSDEHDAAELRKPKLEEPHDPEAALRKFLFSLPHAERAWLLEHEPFTKYCSPDLEAKMRSILQDNLVRP